ncbi:TIGR03899 family protein [Paraneptunicella aestuarii]|uniref:TIGR03899 family protein n=1 Tax=Paraneptunicella aestuarii TaxID=2831148 RepID=UPI001E64A60C|nr:TIGR03899 family protein [Paraneptunicella aestuarii]UAA39352.1 TIGR03899 family protein [Paraneptunicella aestuarii]
MTDIGPIKSTLPQTSVATTGKRSSKSVSQPQTEPQHSNSAQEREAAAVRITRLFHQAGVTTSKFSKLDEDTNKKLARRKQVQQSRKLSNLERILEKALEFSPEQSSDEQVDLDWFFSFVDLAENIFSTTMQEIWGKIFAVEVSKPGTFSLRTLQTLKQLTQRDAKIFQNAVSLTSRMKGENSPKILYGYYQKPNLMTFLGLSKGQQLNLAEYGLTYPNLLTLMDAGLIFNSEIESGELDPSKRSEWKCGAETYYLAPKKSGIMLNYYKFTATGAELSKLVSSIPNSQYLQALKYTLQGGFEVN